MAANIEHKRTVWITGASSGIGAALAEELLQRGDRVAISALPDQQLKTTFNRLRDLGECISVPLDVSDRNACKTAVESISGKFGRIDLAVLNAGVFLPVEGSEIQYEVFDDTFDVNFGGVINCLIPVLEIMKESNAGQIALMGAAAGYSGLPTSAAYGASKAALINLAESLKFDFDRMNIKLQIANPGFVDTALTKELDFGMPFLLPVGKAAKRLADGLESAAFEITFPRRFTWQMKLGRMLPYRLYFPLVGLVTGANKK